MRTYLYLFLSTLLLGVFLSFTDNNFISAEQKAISYLVNSKLNDSKFRILDENINNYLFTLFEKGRSLNELEKADALRTLDNIFSSINENYKLYSMDPNNTQGPVVLHAGYNDENGSYGDITFLDPWEKGVTETLEINVNSGPIDEDARIYLWGNILADNVVRSTGSEYRCFSSYQYCYIQLEAYRDNNGFSSISYDDIDFLTNGVLCN